MDNQQKIINFPSKNLVNKACLKKTKALPPKVKKIHRFKILKPGQKNSPRINVKDYRTINDRPHATTSNKIINNITQLNKKSNSISKKNTVKENKEKENEKIKKETPLTNRASGSTLNLFKKSIPNDHRMTVLNSYFYSNIDNCRSFYSNANISDIFTVRNFSPNKKNCISKVNSPVTDNRNYKDIYSKNDEFHNSIIVNTFVYKKAKPKKITLKNDFSPASSKININSNNNSSRCCINKVILRNKKISLNKKKNYLQNISQKNIAYNNNLVCSPIHKYNSNYNYGSVDSNYYQNTDKRFNKFRNDINNNINSPMYQKNNSTNNILNGIIINNNNNKYNNNNFNYYYGNCQKNPPNNYFKNVIKKYLISTIDNSFNNNSPINKKSISNCFNRSSDNIFQSIIYVQKQVLLIQKNYRMHLGKIKYNIIKTFSKYINGLKIIKKLIKRKYLNRLILNILIFTSRNSSKFNATLNEGFNEKNNIFKKCNPDFNNTKINAIQHKKSISNKSNYNQPTNNLEQDKIPHHSKVEIESLSDTKNSFTELNNMTTTRAGDFLGDSKDFKKIDFFSQQNNKNKILVTKNENIRRRKQSPKFYQVPNLDNFQNINSNNIFYKIYNKENHTLGNKNKYQTIKKA